MSDQLRQQITALDREINIINDKVVSETKKEADARKRIAQIEANLKNYSKNISMLNMKQKEIERENDKIIKCNTDRASLQKQLADKTKKKADVEQQLRKGEAAVNIALRRELMQVKNNYTSLMTKLETEKIQREQNLLRMSDIISELKEGVDVFISHASDDKTEIAEPLAKALAEKGIKVFYDKDSIEWGDSIPAKIDNGLANCKMALIIVSPAFIRKKWTKKEFDALQMLDATRILPLWHKTTKKEVQDFSPTFAAIKAISTADYTIPEIADKIDIIINGK